MLSALLVMPDSGNREHQKWGGCTFPEVIQLLCDTFKKRAKHKWNYLRDGERFNFPKSEKTLTDINLLEIMRAHPQEVRVHKCNRYREGTQTCADWEWWLGTVKKNKWISLRVQAKNLNCKTRTYDKINYPGASATQLGLLIRDAHKEGHVPMYCFYNYWSSREITVSSRCPTYPYPFQLQGCTLATAEFIRSLHHSVRGKLEELAKRWLPWHCLVCCTGYSSSSADLVDRATGVLREFFGVGEGRIKRRDDPPPYVLSVARGDPVEAPPTRIAYVLVTTENDRA